MKLKARLASAAAVGAVVLAGAVATAAPASAAPVPAPVRAEAGDVTIKAPGTYAATTWAAVTNRTCAYTSCGARTTLAANTTYVVNCWVYGETVRAEGYVNNIWLQVRWTDGSVGYSSAIYFKGDARGNLPAGASC
ncbi:hypothetical protein E0500_023535 [Streptomyces sp. KM273126]|uniref:hypothetical protein n=1 Tax=Streptomyces sp. KM273126 TaxID=2545247 RepID=UPI00103A1A2E|nr:hypothetical protein [Streptomyces sp. KM273126]MBA2810282.1 hypothetical protein [Streptomyces sp. KM273126]